MYPEEQTFEYSKHFLEDHTRYAESKLEGSS